MIDVFLNDNGLDWNASLQHFREAHIWAEINCPSYQKLHVQEVIDVSHLYDYVAQYQFEDEQDAVIFQLKWK